VKFGLYHGYELSGSGSNEYTRYLVRTLAQLGHEVVLICADPHPEDYDFVARGVAYDTAGNASVIFHRETNLAPVSLHRLPRTSVYPVYITDKQREGNVKAFPDLTDDELAEYHRAMVNVVRAVLSSERPQVLHTNHVVYQPVVAAEVCPELGIPFYVVPHGSAIEYTVQVDDRFKVLAKKGLDAASDLFWIAREVRDRVYALYPDIRPALEAKSHMVGVGTDTSLFKPLTDGQRPEALRTLKTKHAELRAKHERPGKTEALRSELKRRLATGDVQATRAFWDAYNHKLPDDDLARILDKIPLNHYWLFFVGAMTYGKGIQSLIAAMPGIVSRQPDTQLILVGAGTYREVLEALAFSLESQDERLFGQIVDQGQDLERQKMSGPLEDVQAYAKIAANRRLLFEYGPKAAAQIHFLGRLDHPLLKHIFPCCQIAAFPSVIKEASPLVFAEALSNSVLPTGAYHSGLRDGLDDLRPHLPEAVWQRMKLGDGSETRIQTIVDNLSFLLGELAEHDIRSDLRRLAEARYDWNSIAKTLVGTAERIVVGRRPG
jgi:glycosyltransferase involved in cell wall biosynthesis